MKFVHWLALLFIALKLTNYIDWSWWWVLSPLIAFVIAESLRNLAKNKRSVNHD